jgi:hypothetical protein
LGRRRRMNAHYVFDAVSTFRARPIRAERKRTRANALEVSIGDRERVPMAWFLWLWC